MSKRHQHTIPNLIVKILRDHALTVLGSNANEKLVKDMIRALINAWLLQSAQSLRRMYTPSPYGLEWSVDKGTISESGHFTPPKVDEPTTARISLMQGDTEISSIDVEVTP